MLTQVPPKSLRSMIGDGAAGLREAAGEGGPGLAGPDDDGVEVFGHQTRRDYKESTEESNRVFEQCCG